MDLLDDFRKTITKILNPFIIKQTTWQIRNRLALQHNKGYLTKKKKKPILTSYIMVKCKKVFFNHQKKDEMVISQFLFNIVLEILHKTMKKYI